MKQELITKKKKLPEGWKWVRLGDKEVSKIIMGQSPPSFTYNTEKKGLPFYQGKKDFGLHHPIPTVWCSEPKRIAEEGDILISVRAPVGPTNIANEKCCIGRGLAVIRPKIERDYLLFLLKYNVERLKKKGRGSTFDAINKDKLYDFKIILPPLPERQKIVSKLDKQMAQIEMMKKEVEKQSKRISELPSSILNEVFGQYEISDEV
jgi:type I restriction enzyme S subunit